MLRNRPVLAIFVTLLFTGLAFFLGTHEQNRPDGHSVAESQLAKHLIGDTPSFEHPSLLRRGLDIVAMVTGQPESVSDGVQLGRKASAVFMALAIGGLVLLATCLRSPTAPLWVGVLACLHWALLQEAHTFSPDSALLFGLVLMFLSMVVYDRMPAGGSALLMGICVGIAASAKYFGFIGILLVLPAFWGPRRRERGKIGRRFVVTLSGALVTFMILNLSLFWNFASFWEGLLSATGRLWNVGEEGLGIPNLSGLANGWLAVSWYLIFFAFWWFVRSAMHENPRRPWERVMAALPFLMMLLLTFSRDGSWSHFLPGTMGLVFLAGFGAAWITENAWNRIARPISVPVVILFTLLAIGGSAWSFIDVFKKYHVAVADSPVPAAPGKAVSEK